MKMPPLLLGATLLFWGWQTEFWLFALPMAFFLEASRLLDWQWQLSAKDFRLISQICLGAFVLSLVYILLDSELFFYTLFCWLPVICFPLILAQAYSTSTHLELRQLFFFSPGRQKRKTTNTTTLLDLKFPYFAICIFSASAGNTKGISFYLGMFVLTSLLLYSVRSRRFSPWIWGCLIILVGSSGLAGYISLYRLDNIIDRAAIQWLSNFYRPHADPFQRSTAIGDIGYLKLSQKIVLRVGVQEGENVPKLLRQATYNKYNSSVWGVADRQFISGKPDAQGTRWKLASKPARFSEVTVSATLHKGEGLLKLPQGTFQVNQLPVLTLEKNQYGTVKVEGETNFISYQALFQPNLAVDGTPTKQDLQIPEREKPALKQILKEIDINGKSSQEIAELIYSFFQNKFAYSLKLKGSNNNNNNNNISTPLANFLLKNRAGHCEYFATATTLLLRTAGIPARYAIGYSVHEFSPLENQFIVRSRHAHAWTLAYIDGSWQTLDTTPPSWINIENDSASQLEFISDFWSWLGFKVTLVLRQIKEGQALKKYWWCLLIPLVVIIGRQFNSQKLIHRKTSSSSTLKNSESESQIKFYLIEKILIKSGFPRPPSETLKTWLVELENHLPAPIIDDLKNIVELYYCHRFDPEGITKAQKTKLQSSIQSWLVSYNKNIRKRKPSQ